MEDVADQIDEYLRACVPKSDHPIRVVVVCRIRRVNPVQYPAQIVIEDVDYWRRTAHGVDLPNVVIERIAIQVRSAGEGVRCARWKGISRCRTSNRVLLNPAMGVVERVVADSHIG